MRRRVLLSTLGLALTTPAAGCLGGGAPPVAEDGGTEDPDGTDDGSGGSGTATRSRFVETSLTGTGRCEQPGTASVRFGADGVTVTGCARGPNGCAVPALADASYTPDGGLLTVVVASRVERHGDVGCTQALVPLGYEVRVVMDGTVPEAVSVVHDDVDGRREVVRVGRDGA
jgi:hypothetical protein